MIEEGRYHRLIYYMGQDIRYLLDNVRQHETVLRNIFGVEKFKQLEQKIIWLESNHRELKEDLAKCH